MKNKFKIKSIVIAHEIEENADTSFIGEYTSDLKEGTIVRQYDKFYEDLTEEEIENITLGGRNHTGFIPYGGGEKKGSQLYKEYGRMDYKRMEQLNSGSFDFLCITAYADIYSEIENEGCFQHQKIRSLGVCGIESDSSEDFIKEMEDGQLENLREQLKSLNVDMSNFDLLIKDI